MIAGQQAMNSGMIVILTYGGNRQVVFVGAITSHMATACSESTRFPHLWKRAGTESAGYLPHIRWRTGRGSR